eukprot:s144_g15.t1
MATAMTKPVEKAPGNPHYRGTELCSFFLKGMCRHGTKCNFAHSINDLKDRLKSPILCDSVCLAAVKGSQHSVGSMQHKFGFGAVRPASYGLCAEKPDFSKTRLCTNYFKTKSCAYGMSCSFAHSKDEMRSAARSRAARDKASVTGLQGKQDLLRRPDVDLAQDLVSVPWLRYASRSSATPPTSSTPPASMTPQESYGSLLDLLELAAASPSQPPVSETFAHSFWL